MAALSLKPAPLSSTTGVKRTLNQRQEAQRAPSKALIIITHMKLDNFNLQTSIVENI